jgi:hypothetical protein
VTSLRLPPVSEMIRLLSLTLFLALIVASPAIASRPPTPEEATAIADAEGVPSECVHIEVSDVDPSWALMTARNLQGCFTADGLVIVKRQPSGAWRTLYQGPAERNVAICEAIGMTLRTGRDLGQRYRGSVCRKRRTYILCTQLPIRREVVRVAREKPSRCMTLGPLGSFGGSANLARLKWRQWSRPVATARGIERGFHHPLARIPVRVRAYRLRRDCAGDRVYTRLKVVSRHGSLLIRYPTCFDE